MLDSASARLDGRLDPLGDFHNFELKLKITGINLTKLNQVSEAYGNFNFKSGNGDFVMELQAEDAQLTGYAKPVLDNVEIFDLEEDLEDGVFSAAWQAIVGAFGQIFRNDPKIVSLPKLRYVAIWMTPMSVPGRPFSPLWKMLL